MYIHIIICYHSLSHIIPYFFMYCHQHLTHLIQLHPLSRWRHGDHVLQGFRREPQGRGNRQPRDNHRITIRKYHGKIRENMEKYENIWKIVKKNQTIWKTMEKYDKNGWYSFWVSEESTATRMPKNSEVIFPRLRSWHRVAYLWVKDGQHMVIS